MKVSLLNKTGFILLLTAVFLNSCATYVSVRVRKPAEVNIEKIKKIQVNEFNFQGSRNREKDTGDILAELGVLAVDYLAKELGWSSPVAREEVYPGWKISSRLTGKLQQNGYYSVMDMPYRDKEVTDFTALKQTGADAVITGNGNYTISETGGWKEDITHNKSNNTTIKNLKYAAARRIDLNLNIKVVNVKNGELIAVLNFDDYEYETAEGKNQEEAEDKFGNWQNKVDGMADLMLDKAVKKIAPYYVYEQREIKDGKLPQMKQALELSKNHLWDSSKKLWEEVLAMENAEKEDLVNASYNLGIYYEINDMLAEAAKYFSECYDLGRKSECITARNRVEHRKYEVEKLIQQTSL